MDQPRWKKLVLALLQLQVLDTFTLLPVRHLTSYSGGSCQSPRLHILPQDYILKLCNPAVPQQICTQIYTKKHAGTFKQCYLLYSKPRNNYYPEVVE